MIGEVICEMIIPILMARIVDNGIYGGNMGYIFQIGAIMIAIAILGLISGIGGAYFGAKASTGLARNLRKAMLRLITSCLPTVSKAHSTISMLK